MLLAAYTQIEPIEVGTIFLILNKKDQVQGVKFEGVTPDNFILLANSKGKKEIYSPYDQFIYVTNEGKIYS
jgi:hypothetical protein